MACQNHRSELAISRFVIVYLMPRSITPTRKQRARKIRRVNQMETMEQKVEIERA